MADEGGIGWSVASGLGEPAFPPRVGPYRVEAELGRGGGGVVLAARDPLGRPVALKLLLPGAPPAARDRLQREAELCARLDHPGLVRLLDAGQAAGAPFLAFERVEEARPLDTAMRGLDPAAAARLVLTAAQAVGHAHQRGVVHRDLKPENVLVDREGRVRVIDFGVGAGEGLDRLTLSGALLGTPLHMAPEQLLGDRERQGPATDVWALGLLLFQALTGTPPFRAVTFEELRARVFGSERPNPRAIGVDVAPALDAVVRRALAVEPGERQPDALAFAAELEAALAPLPSARAPTRSALALLLPLLLGLGLLGWTRFRAPAPAPDPGPAASPPSQAASADPAGLAWSELERGGTAGLLAGGLEWLERFPDAPKAERVRDQLAALARVQPARVLDCGSGPVQVAFTPAGALVTLSSGATASRLRLLSWRGERLAEQPLPARAGLLVQGGDRLAVLLPDAPPRLFAAEDLLPLRGPEEPAQLLALDLAGRRLAWWEGGVLHVADAAAPAARVRLESARDATWLAFAAEGRLIAAGLEEAAQEPAALQLYASRDGARVGPPRLLTSAVQAGASDGARLAFACYEGLAVLARTPEDPAGDLLLAGEGIPPRPRNLLPQAHPGAVRALAFVPGGRQLWTAGALDPGQTSPGELRAWRVEDGRQLEQRALTIRPVALAVSPDRRWLAVGGEDGEAQLWLIAPP